MIQTILFHTIPAVNGWLRDNDYEFIDIKFSLTEHQENYLVIYKLNKKD